MNISRPKSMRGGHQSHHTIPRGPRPQRVQAFEPQDEPGRAEDHVRSQRPWYCYCIQVLRTAQQAPCSIDTAGGTIQAPAAGFVSTSAFAIKLPLASSIYAQTREHAVQHDVTWTIQRLRLSRIRSVSSHRPEEGVLLHCRTHLQPQCESGSNDRRELVRDAEDLPLVFFTRSAVGEVLMKCRSQIRRQPSSSRCDGPVLAARPSTMPEKRSSEEVV